jgi:hypothetical protein
MENTSVSSVFSILNRRPKMRVTVGMVVHAGATYCPRFCGSVELKAKIPLREREDSMKLGVIGIPERVVGNHASFILVIGMLSSVKLDAINRRRHSALEQISHALEKEKSRLDLDRALRCSSSVWQYHQPLS